MTEKVKYKSQKWKNSEVQLVVYAEKMEKFAQRTTTTDVDCGGAAGGGFL